MIRQLAGALMLLCVISGAHAQTVRWKQFVHPDDDADKALNNIYLAGVRDGLYAVNSELQSRGTPLLFCLPPKLSLTVDQTADIVTREAKEHGGNINETPIVIILLQGLIKTFPCERQNQ
jgi:hypothetical protein